MTAAATPAVAPTSAPASDSAPSEAAPPLSEPGGTPAAPEGTEGAQSSEGELDAETLAALENASEDGSTVNINGQAVPIEALQAALEENPDLLKKLRRKVRAAGEEREITLAEALEAVPKVRGWQKRMEEAAQQRKEAAQQRKQVEQLVERMKSDPVGALEQILGSEDAVYERMLEHLRYRGMSPEQRAQIDAERELRRKAELGEEYLQRLEQERVERATAQAREAWQRDILGALQSSGQRGTPWEIARAAGYVSEVLEHLPDGAKLTPQQQAQLARQAADYVRQERERERAAEVEGLDDDGILKYLGDDLARRAARAYAKRVRAAQGMRPEPLPEPAGGRTREPAAPPPRRSIEDLLDELQEKDRRGEWSR